MQVYMYVRQQLFELSFLLLLFVLLLRLEQMLLLVEPSCWSYVDYKGGRKGWERSGAVGGLKRHTGQAQALTPVRRALSHT